MLILRARQWLWWSNLRKELLPHTWFAVLQLIIKIKIVEVALDHTRRSIQHSQNIFDCLGQVIMDAVVYVLPVVWGLPPTIVSAYFQAFVYDRQWFFEQCAWYRAYCLLCAIFKLQVVAQPRSFAALLAMLRDKKLISKNRVFGNHDFVSAGYDLDDIRRGSGFPVV